MLSQFSVSTLKIPTTPLKDGLAAKTIVTVSGSKRIFITSFENNGFSPGDFITVIYKNQHVFRALVAKTKGERAGVKVVKIYSPKLWNKMKKGLQVQILRGDDSYFINKELMKKAKKEKEEGEQGILGNNLKIVDDDDLFNKKNIS